VGGDEEEAWPASPLWDYAVALYGRPGVEAACLALQDRAGADVNLLLAACWLGETGRSPRAEDLSRLREEAQGWQAAVVRPLREARRALKARSAGLDGALRGPVEAARRRLRAVELAAERAELALIEGLAGPAPRDARPRPDLARRALRVLADLGPGEARDVAALLAAAFPAPRDAGGPR
jgi:uncharacterized protein (TIGR02444 family)